MIGGSFLKVCDATKNKHTGSNSGFDRKEDNIEINIKIQYEWL